MLRISNGRTVLVVSKSAFKALYEDQGFYACDGSEDASETIPELVMGQTAHEEDKQPEEVPGESEDDEYVDSDAEEDLTEIPLSEMNYEQLIQRATELDIDHRGIRSKRELRIAIRQAMQD